MYCLNIPGVGLPQERKPQRSYTLLNRESPAFIRFVNPGDYRVATRPAAPVTCRSSRRTAQPDGDGCHVPGGLPTQWRAPFKRYILGEAYTSSGQAAGIQGPVLPDPSSALSLMVWLPACKRCDWETVPPADVFASSNPGGADRQPVPRDRRPNITVGCKTSTSRGVLT